MIKGFTRRSLAKLATVALLVGAGALTAAQANQLEDIQKRGEITIGTEGTYAPFTFHNDDDVLTGYDVEVGRAIAKALGVKAKFVETPWDGMIAGVDAKRFDIAINQVTPNPEREQKYLFSVPYMYDHGVLIVKKGNDKIKSLQDAKGLTAAQGLSSNWTAYSQKLGANLVNAPGSSEAFNLVETGRADFTMNSGLAFADYLTKKPNARLSVAAQTPESVIAAVLIRKNSPELKAAIDKAIEQMQKDGTLKALSLKYLNTDVSKP